MVRQRRKLLLLLLLVYFPVASTFHQLFVEWKAFTSASSPDELSRFAVEVAPFLKYTSGQKQTGFFTDLPDSDPAGSVDMIMLQYQVLPTILVRSAHTEYALGRLHNASTTATLLEREHLRIVQCYSEVLYFSSKSAK